MSSELITKGKGKGVKSQRPSWSCTECSRRKIRCDKVIPCRPCILRGAGDACHLSTAENHPKLPKQIQSSNSSTPRLATAIEMDNIRNSLGLLTRQLFQLQQVVDSFSSDNQSNSSGGPLYAYNGGNVPDRIQVKIDEEIDELDESSFRETNNHREASTSRLNPLLERVREDTQQLPDSDGEVEAATTLEFLALGRDRKQDHLNRSELRRPDSPHFASPTFPDSNSTSSALPITSSNVLFSNSNSTDILPPKQLCDAIVRYSLENFGWQHGSGIHRETFEAETVQFYQWGERRGKLVNQAWMGLYYAILCVGYKHMSTVTATEFGISLDDLKTLPKRFFDAAVDALYRANFLAKHSIFSVQTIAILVMTCQDVGGSDLIATLLATGIRIAQHLNLHRFTSDIEWQAHQLQKGVDPLSEVGIKALIDREIRKRLWCGLTTEDWFSIAYRRSYAVHPSHCTTPLPINCFDSDLAAGQIIHRPLDEVTPVTKLLLSMRIASFVRIFFDGTNSGQLNYELCLHVDAEIRNTIRLAPYALQVNADLKNSPPHIRFMAHYWLMSSSHKLLIIHRTFLGRKNPKYAYSKTAAINAATQILYEFPKGALLPFQDLWTSIFHCVAASTTLVMGMFQSDSPASDDTNALVEASLQELARLQETSPIAARGVQLLSNLLSEASRRSVAASKLGSKRKREEDNFGNVAKRVSNSVQTSPPSSSTTSLSPATSLGIPFLSGYPSLPPPNTNFDSLLSTTTSTGFGYGMELGLAEGETDFEFWRLLEGFETPGGGVDNHQESGTWSS